MARQKTERTDRGSAKRRHFIVGREANNTRNHFVEINGFFPNDMIRTTTTTTDGWTVTKLTSKTGLQNITFTTWSPLDETKTPTEDGLTRTTYATPIESRLTISNFLRHTLGRNRYPGFCPGAFSLRKAQPDKSGLFRGKLHTQMSNLNRCQECKLVLSAPMPGSYSNNWDECPQLSDRFAFQSHVNVSADDNSARRACLICWEKKAEWTGAMDADQWGAHTRKHFEHDGYEVCMTEDGKQRPRHACPVKKCPKIHG